MKYDILHELPGRMRVHCRNLRLNPGCRVELNRWVFEHSELTSASLSAHTGNLLVFYTKNTSRESILVILDDLRIFGMATLGGGYERRYVTIAGATASASVKVFFSSLLAMVLPQALQKFFSGWKLGCFAYALADNLANRRMSVFFYAVCKFLLLRIFTTPLPIRVAIMTCSLVIENKPLDHNFSKPTEYLEEALNANRREQLPDAV